MNGGNTSHRQKEGVNEDEPVKFVEISDVSLRFLLMFLVVGNFIDESRDENIVEQEQKQRSQRVCYHSSNKTVF